MTLGTERSTADLSAYLQAALDCVVIADASGRIVEFNPAAERTFGYTRQEAVGRTLAELIIPPSLRERHARAFARFVDTGEETLFGRRVELTGMRADGSEFPVELALSRVTGEPLVICGALRDLSETKRAEDDLRKLADEQAVLRRVATLVAQRAAPAEVFAAVAEGVARLLGVPAISMTRFEPDGTATKIGSWGESTFPVGTRWELDEPSVMALIAQTGRPARIDDYAIAPGAHAELVAESGIRSGAGVPIIVDGKTWGAVIAFTNDPQPLSEDAEERLARFTELVGTAISNTEARDDLQRLADEQAALRRVATLVTQGPTPRQVFASVVEEAARLLDFPLISMVRYEQDGTASVIATSHERPFPIGSRLTLDGASVISLVRDTGRSARIDDYTDVPGSIAASAREAGIRAAVGSPIVVDGKTWGAMVAVALEEQPLPADTDSRLGDFTELVATAISNAQAGDDLRQLADEQAALRRVATLVASEAPADQVFAEMAESAAGVLGVPMIAMIRFEPDGTSTAIANWGGAYPYPPGTRFPPHPGLIHEVTQTARPARVDSYADLPDDNSAELTAAGIRSSVGAPITVNGKLWGLIAAGSDTDIPLPADTAGRLSDFTQLLATALANAQARDDLRRLAEEQAALRRVATLVAREATPAEVFAAVAKEVAATLDVPLTAVVRFETDGMATQVGVWGEENPFPVGTSWPLDERSVSGLVSSTGQPARVEDYAEIPGGIAATLAREAGIRTAVGAPVLVDGKPWGVMMALSTAQRPIPAGTEDRLAAFTELVATAIANTQARDELRQLAEEQAALRRVATLVARGTDAHAVFDAVCAETGPLIGASSVNLASFTADGFNLTMAGWSLRDTHVPTGTRLPLGPGTINGVIQRTVAPARVDSYEDAHGELAALVRQRGIRSEVGAPVIVEGQLWGALIAGTDGDEALPARAERRVASFAELIATAVSNASTRSELIASRARIVAAGDEARRRIERNLHDGTQQRLVALGLDLQAVRASLPADQHDAQSDLERISREIEAVLEDVREVSRGLHPALLSQAGLGPSLRGLARKSPIPVSLDISVSERPSESIEIAVYYAISEALANAAKHAQASEISVALATISNGIRATIRDDGVGGAEASAGSGLVGLIDRVEALGGRFTLDSPPGNGTRISIELPLAARAVGEVTRRRPSPSAHEGSAALQRQLAELAEADTLLAAVAATAEALYIVDAQGRIRFLNPAAVQILGYEDERQLLGRPSHDTIHYLRADGTPFPAAECPLLRPRVTGETVRVEDDWFVRQDGTLVPVAYSSAPVRLPDGRGAVVSFRKRSERPFDGTASEASSRDPLVPLRSR